MSRRPAVSKSLRVTRSCLPPRGASSGLGSFSGNLGAEIGWDFNLDVNLCRRVEAASGLNHLFLGENFCAECGRDIDLNLSKRVEVTGSGIECLRVDEKKKRAKFGRHCTVDLKLVYHGLWKFVDETPTH